MSLADLMGKGRLRRPAVATSATSATDGPQCAGAVATVAEVAVATAADSNPAKDPALDPDRWCWPHSGAMNTTEIEMFTVRLRHFTSRVAAGADALADLLVERDRNADYRRLCIECRDCQAGPHCQQGMAVMSELQRCNQFVCHPALETIRCEGGDDQ